MAQILVIDDMPGVRRAVSSTLKKAGHKVTEVDDGAAGLKLVDEGSFDLIITDILMPGTDGIEVIMSLKARPGGPRVIAMSGGGAHVTSVDALLLAEQAADASLSKPFDGRELMAAVETVLR